jgi:hypothetical protein
LVPVQHGHDSIEFVFDVHHDVWFEGAGSRERVRKHKDDGTTTKVGYVGTDGGDSEQVGRILNEQARESMIGVIIGNAVGDYEVRAERSDQANHLMPELQSVVELAIGLIENFVGRADRGASGLSLSPAPTCQPWPVHRLVTGLAIGQADQSNDMAQRTPLGRGTTGLDVGIIRMRTDHEDSQRSICHGFGSSSASFERANQRFAVAGACLLAAAFP